MCDCCHLVQSYFYTRIKTSQRHWCLVVAKSEHDSTDTGSPWSFFGLNNVWGCLSFGWCRLKSQARLTSLPAKSWTQPSRRVPISQVKALWWPSRQHFVKYEPEFSFEAWLMMVDGRGEFRACEARVKSWGLSENSLSWNSGFIIVLTEKSYFGVCRCNPMYMCTECAAFTFLTIPFTGSTWVEAGGPAVFSRVVLWESWKSTCFGPFGTQCSKLGDV